MSNKKKFRQKIKEQQQHFNLIDISPLTVNQQKVFEAYRSGLNLVLHGYAGTGKSYISLYLALKELLSGVSYFDKIIIVRSAVPSRDVGYLPGSLKEKTKIYEDPYKEICDELFDRGDGYDILKMKNMVQFTTTSYLRGLTFNNAIVIVDEAQNITFPELYTTLTRLGNESRLILCGDFRQLDLDKKESNDSLAHIMNVLRRLSNTRIIEFGKEDIVRSAFVKEFIVASTEYQDTLEKPLL